MRLARIAVAVSVVLLAGCGGETTAPPYYPAAGSSSGARPEAGTSL